MDLWCRRHDPYCLRLVNVEVYRRRNCAVIETAALPSKSGWIADEKVVMDIDSGVPIKMSTDYSAPFGGKGLSESYVMELSGTMALSTAEF